MTLIADTHPEEPTGHDATARPAADDAADDAASTARDAGAKDVGAGSVRGDAHASDGSPAGDGAGEVPAGENKARQAVIAIPPALEAGLRAERRETEGVEAKPRGLGARLLDYSAHAAMIVGLIGFAWTVSNHVVSHPAPAGGEASLAAPAERAEAETLAGATVATKTAAAKAVSPGLSATPDPTAAELAELRRSNERLAADIGGLRAQLDALASANSRVPGQVKGLQIALDNVQGSLAVVRSESASSTAQLNARLDKLARERDAAVARPERGSADLTTGSLPPARTEAETAPKVAAVPLPPSKPEAARVEAPKPEMAKAEPGPAGADDARRGADADKPPVIAAYVVRDVARGVALIEGRRGLLEVVPGVSIPGAGIVKSIERRGKGWTVITTKGQLAYAAPLPTYRRDGGRDYYPSYRYDF